MNDSDVDTFDPTAAWVLRVQPRARQGLEATGTHEGGHLLTVTAAVTGPGPATLGLVWLGDDAARALGRTVGTGTTTVTLTLRASLEDLPEEPSPLRTAWPASASSPGPRAPRGLFVLVTGGALDDRALTMIARERATSPGPGAVPIGSMLSISSGGDFVPAGWPGWPATSMGPDTFSRQALEAPAGGGLIAVGGRRGPPDGQPATALSAQRGPRAVVARPTWIPTPATVSLCLLELPALGGASSDQLELFWSSGTRGRAERVSCHIRPVEPDQPVSLVVPEPVDQRVQLCVDRSGRWTLVAVPAASR